MDISGSIFVGAVVEPSKGMWFNLPVSGKEVVEQLKLMGAITSDEEYMITDYEMPFNYMRPGHDFRTIDDLTERFKYMQGLDYDVDTFKLLVDAQLINPMNFTQDDLDNIEVFDAKNLDELGQEIVENIGGVSELTNDNLETYFDYNFFAMDHIKEGSIVEEKGTYIRDNRN